MPGTDTARWHHPFDSRLPSVMQCTPKPEGDKYGFSSFARMLLSGKGLNPLPSDSRRRPDRTALEVCLTPVHTPSTL